MRHMGLLITMFGLSGVLGCAQDPIETSTTIVPVPASTVRYARAAVEVGKIAITEMSRFEASVERMDVGARTALWLSLKELHDRSHPSATVTPGSELSVAEEAGCSTDHCSHSDQH